MAPLPASHPVLHAMSTPTAWASSLTLGLGSGFALRLKCPLHLWEAAFLTFFKIKLTPDISKGPGWSPDLPSRVYYYVTSSLTTN